MTILFWNFSPKIPNLLQNLGFLLFREILQLDKFEDVDFKYDKILLKF